MLFGTAVIDAAAATWLAHSLDISATKAIELGLTPFLLGDDVRSHTPMSDERRRAAHRSSRP